MGTLVELNWTGYRLPSLVSPCPVAPLAATTPKPHLIWPLRIFLLVQCGMLGRWTLIVYFRSTLPAYSAIIVQISIAPMG